MYTIKLELNVENLKDAKIVRSQLKNFVHSSFDEYDFKIEFSEDISAKTIKIRNKGDLMRAIYTPNELASIDSAIPIEYWNGKNPDIQVDTAIHVMNYNMDRPFGKLENMEEIAKERKIKIQWVKS